MSDKAAEIGEPTGMEPESAPVQKQPRRRFIGKRAAAELQKAKAEANGSEPSLEDGVSVQGNTIPSQASISDVKLTNNDQSPHDHLEPLAQPTKSHPKF